MRRREFITLLGAAASWPHAAAGAAGGRMRRIGLLMGGADDPDGQARVTALKQGLEELGWTDGRNIQIDTRFAGADAARMRADAAELVALAPDVLVGQTTRRSHHERGFRDNHVNRCFLDNLSRSTGHQVLEMVCAWTGSRPTTSGRSGQMST